MKIHGLYPVRDEGPQGSVDVTSHQQALQFSPDGTYAGPVTCSACHRVNDKGVPVKLEGTELRLKRRITISPFTHHESRLL